MKRFTAVAAGVTALLGASATASAWEPLDDHRPVWRSTVPYELNSAGSDDLGVVSESVVRQAMDDWTRVACTSLRNDYRGLVSRIARSRDGYSTIGWVESGWDYDSNAIGVTGPLYGGSIVEADMELNGEDYRWTTADGVGYTVNAYSIVLHEGGHYYGLGHSNVAGSTMYPSYAGGTIALHSDDRQGICALYPGSGGCTSDAGCPSDQRCDLATFACVPRAPSGLALGAACAVPTECASGLCIAGFCSQSCDWLNPGGSCPAGFLCSSEAAGSCSAGGVCVAGVVGPKAVGQPCASGGECASMVCSSGLCAQPCAPGGAGCPAGSACHDGVLAGCGFCLESAGVGEACELNEDCAAGLCARGALGDRFCTSFCDGGVACPAGFHCVPVGDRAACAPDSGELGSGCATDAECLSGICADVDGTKACARPCDETAVCPADFECRAAGEDGNVCALEGGGGCGCSAPGRGASNGWLLGFFALGAVVVGRARRRAR